MKLILFFIALVNIPAIGYSQTELPLASVLKIIAEGHPLYQNAGLYPKTADAVLLASKGGFDPIANLENQKKEFDGTEYYNYQSIGLQIPLWIGDIQTGYESVSGQNINPENLAPSDGLTHIGLSIPLLKNVVTDKRRTALRQARIFQEQNNAIRTQSLNELAHSVILDYTNWYFAWVELGFYRNALLTTGNRLEGLRKLVEAGSIAAIDTLETNIQLKNFIISLKSSELNFQKAGIVLSTHLWSKDLNPLEPSADAIPSLTGISAIDSLYSMYPDTLIIGSILFHPAMAELFAINNIQKLDTRLKKQNLLPDVKLKYNTLSTGFYDLQQNFTTNNYQFGIGFKSSLFLREQRGEYQMANLKLESLKLKTEFKQRELENKIKSEYLQTNVYRQLKEEYATIVLNYNVLYLSELSRFDAGESNLFLVNTRELRLIDSRLKEMEYNKKYIQSGIDYLKNSGILHQIIPTTQMP